MGGVGGESGGGPQSPHAGQIWGRGMGRCDPEFYGACAQHFPGRVHRPPHQTGWTPVRDRTLEFGVSSPVHCPPSAHGGLYPKTGLAPSYANSTCIGGSAPNPFPVTEKSVCQNTWASEQCFRMHSGQPKRSPLPQAGTRTRPNPGWDSNPRGWASDRAKTHGTWFQELMKLRFSMSLSQKEFSERQSDR